MQNRRDFVTKLAALAAAAAINPSDAEAAARGVLHPLLQPSAKPLLGFAVNPFREKLPGYEKTWNLMSPGGIATPEGVFNEKNVAPRASTPKDISWSLDLPKTIVAKAKGKGVVFKGSLFNADNPANRVTPSWYNDVITNWSLAQAVIDAWCEHFVAPFGTDVGYWNVWNEALKPWLHAYDHAGYCDNPFLRYGGVDYKNGFIAYGLTQVHAAAPQAKILLNMDHCEDNPAQRANVLTLVKGLKDAGVPLDIVGTEHHCLSSRARMLADQKQAVIDWAGQMAQHGVGFAITEFDTVDDTPGSPAERDAIHAAITDIVCSTAMAVPGTDHFQCWSLADPWSWLNNGYGPQTTNKPQRCCWLDSNLAPTPAYQVARKYFPRLPTNP